MSHPVGLEAYLRVTRKLLKEATMAAHYEYYFLTEDGKTDSVRNKVANAASLKAVESLAGALSAMYQAGILNSCREARTDAFAERLIQIANY